MDPYSDTCWLMRPPGQLGWDGPFTLAECGERKSQAEFFSPALKGRIETRLANEQKAPNPKAEGQ